MHQRSSECRYQSVWGVSGGSQICATLTFGRSESGPTVTQHRRPSASPRRTRRTLSLIHQHTYKMSDKVRDFAEIPQQFVREGTLVSRFGCCSRTAAYASSSTGARSLLGKVCRELSSVGRVTHGRIHPAVSGGRGRFRCYGIHWVHRQADSYPNVSHLVPTRSPLMAVTTFLCKLARVCYA